MSPFTMQSKSLFKQTKMLRIKIHFFYFNSVKLDLQYRSFIPCISIKRNTCFISLETFWWKTEHFLNLFSIKLVGVLLKISTNIRERGYCNTCCKGTSTPYRWECQTQGRLYTTNGVKLRLQNIAYLNNFFFFFL